jgi:hypothetical protein
MDFYWINISWNMKLREKGYQLMSFAKSWGLAVLHFTENATVCQNLRMARLKKQWKF